MLIKDAVPKQDLDEITGFKEWAEENNFQVYIFQILKNLNDNV